MYMQSSASHLLLLQMFTLVVALQWHPSIATVGNYLTMVDKITFSLAKNVLFCFLFFVALPLLSVPTICTAAASGLPLT